MRSKMGINKTKNKIPNKICFYNSFQFKKAPNKIYSLLENIIRNHSSPLIHTNKKKKVKVLNHS